MRFIITIDGAPIKEVSDNLWQEIARYEVNLLILDKHSYIYGDTTDSVIDILLEKAQKLGFATEIERG